MQFKNTYVIFGAMVAIIFGLSNASQHPISGSSGYTGAPPDSTCGQCHTGNNSNLDGSVTIDGLPSTIITGETYTLTVTITNPNGNAVKGGFQMVALNGSNGQAGSYGSTPPFTSLRNAGGKTYFGHVNAQNFPGSNELSYSIDWTAPATTGTNPVIKFYAASVIANGADGNQNDRVVLTNLQIPIQSGAQPLEATIENVMDISCFGFQDGTATVSATGGTSPYTYQWSNGVTSITNTTLPAGPFTVTVTDNVGTTSTATETISSPPQILVNASGSIVCIGASNGTASVLASGGTGGFSYEWNTGDITQNITNLESGTYFVTVTDANNCQATGSATVTESPEMTITFNTEDPQCFGDASGYALATVTGGTAPFTYSWSNGGTNQNIQNVTAGTYIITVTDIAQCTSSNTVVINNPQMIVGSTTIQQNVSCFGGNNGIATVSATGGTGPYEFNWSNGSSGVGTTNTQSNLIAGSYSITITDIFDCSATTNLIITQPQDLNLNAVKLDCSCFNANDGSISLNVMGSLGNLSYIWSNNATSAAITNLSPGTYSVTVTDAGTTCTKNASFVINNPTEINIITSVQQPICHNQQNGNILTQVSGGCNGYSYIWTNGSTNSSITNIGPGSYTVTITDCKGCTKTATATVNNPIPIALNIIQSTNASCLGATNGSITISASQGLLPYQYLWSNGATTTQISNVASGNYFITVSDANNCSTIDTFTVGTNASFTINLISSKNILCYGDSTGIASVTNQPNYTYLWSTGQTTATVNTLPAGVHSVVATDNNGCQSLPRTVAITQPPLIKANILSSDTILCPADTNGFLNIALVGGVGALDFNWSHGDTLLLTDTLKAGVYTITIMDENQCVEKYPFTIHLSDTIRVDTINLVRPSCHGDSDGAILLSISGGFGPLDVDWSVPTLSGDSLYNLAAGIYNATVTDLGNCQHSESFTLTQPDTLSAKVNIIDESMNGSNDGKVILTPIGGTGPYQVSWSNGDTTFTIENLVPGIYYYTLTDAKACTYRNWAVVGGGGCLLAATFTTTSASCFNIADGSVTLNITGGQEPYDIKLYKGPNIYTKPLDSLEIGNYTIIISDSTACITILTDVVIVPMYPAIVLDNIDKIRPATETSQDGSLTANVTGGIGTLKYEWFKNGVKIGNTATITQLSAGKYTLIVRDLTDCILVVEDILLNSISATEDAKHWTISILPNPAQDKLSIESSENVSKVEIYDLTGKIQFSQKFEDKSITLDTDLIGLNESGMYLCKLWVNNKSIVKKIVILK